MWPLGAGGVGGDSLDLLGHHRWGIWRGQRGRPAAAITSVAPSPLSSPHHCPPCRLRCLLPVTVPSSPEAHPVSVSGRLRE